VLLLLQVPGSNAVPPSTKLVCTIGPVSNDVETLKQLLAAGMTVCDHLQHVSVPSGTLSNAPL
jgi:hypothetical protein